MVWRTLPVALIRRGEKPITEFAGPLSKNVVQFQNIHFVTKEKRVKKRKNSQKKPKKAKKQKKKKMVERKSQCQKEWWSGFLSLAAVLADP
jgi:hypothetical protein